MDTSRKVLVLGASTNPERYSYKAAASLVDYGFEIIPVGIRQGEVLGYKIITDKKIVQNVHTITLYVGPKNQNEWFDYIINTKPKRVLFNPGTENAELVEKLREAGIETEEACTLVLLSLNAF